MSSILTNTINPVTWNINRHSKHSSIIDRGIHEPTKDQNQFESNTEIYMLCAEGIRLLEIMINRFGMKIYRS